MRRLTGLTSMTSLTGVAALAFSGLLVAAPPSTGSSTGSSAASSPATSTCADALLIAVPGGGEGAAEDPGRTLSALTGSVLAGAQTVDRTVTTRVVHATTADARALRGRGKRRTPATKAVTRRAWRDWRAPARPLTSGIEAVLAETLPACPDQLVYLAGYSQGAEAVHRFLAKRADDDLYRRVVATVLVGDPARVAGSRGRISGRPKAPRSASGLSTRFARKPLPAVPAEGWRGPVHTVCTERDVACDFGPTRFRAAQRVHRSYDNTDSSALLRRLGERYGERLALWPRPVEGQQIVGRVGLLLDEQLQVDIDASDRDRLRFRATSTLPPGLELTRRGAVTGIPSRAGSFEVTYTVRNRSGRALSRPMAGSVAVEIEPGARTQVSAGGRHACEIRTDGTLWCWGANFYGQLGVGDRASGPTPRQVGSKDDWVEVSAGGMHTCGIRENDTLWCWGLNYRGQLGLGNRKDKATPRRVGDFRDWESVSGGWVHTCATRADGSAWCFGDNDYGQLGSGSREDSRVPVAVTQGMAFSEVDAGGWHSCGVTRGGAAYCWGRNVFGQLGDGTKVLRINPARVGSGSGWRSVQPSWTHTCGLSQDGVVSCWGGNEAGQLGGGKFRGTTTPRALGGDRLWSAVETGATSSCALDADQELWCWGTGRVGQLDGPTRSKTPVRLREGTTWSQLDLGWLFGCGLTGTDTTPTCWGNDETGELGPPEEPPPARRPAARRRSGFVFNLVTFNVLGSNHTSPRRDAGEFSPARIRAEWMIDYLRKIRAGVVGFQEIQRDQMGWFTREADAYEVWPGTSEEGDGLQTTIAWKKNTWDLVETDLVAIPFITQTRHMPLVKLQHERTGRSIWVMNVHNAPQGRQQQRNIAVQREIDRLQKVVGKGDPVFLVGDFNERQRAFCEVTGQLGFVAPRGGSHDGKRCQPPSGFMRVDWIFGSPDVDYSGYTEDRSALVEMITDHSVLRTKVSVP